MYWIEPHTDTKILKLGIRWALYREKKPDHLPTINHEWANKHRIGYLKEQEFKVGDLYYKKGKKKGSWNATYTIGDIDLVEFTQQQLSKLYSHYYPGQEESSFKYVRKVETVDKTPISDKFNSTTQVLKYQFEWQEVEQPEENDFEYQDGKVRRTDYFSFEKAVAQFQEDKKQVVIQLEVITKK